MASRFWVGGGSANTWAATVNTNWATTSGGANNASVPTTTDVAVFDSNSGVGNSVIGASITVQGVECDGSTLGTGTYAGTITHNTAVTLTINTGAANSLRLTAGMTYTPASTTALVTFTNTTGTAQVKSAGKAFAAITVNGVGGTVQQKDDILINAISNAVLTITNGIWDANDGGAAHALTAIQVAASANNTRSLILGGLVKIGGNATSGSTIWNIQNTGTLTFTKNSANIEILSPTGANIAWIFAGAALTYNGLTLDATSQQAMLSLTGANTFSAMTINSGWGMQFASNQTISAAFTWTGTPTAPINVYGASATSVVTLSCASGACTVTWGSIANVQASGGATFTSTNTLVSGNTTGWSNTPPADSSTTGLVSAIWRDTTAADFTVGSSIGAALFTAAVPGAAGGLFIAGTNAATSITTALTTNVTGNLSGSVGSVTTRVTANTDQIAGSATGATNLSKTTLAIGRGTVTAGATTTSVPTSAYSIAGKSGPRAIIFDNNTTTTNLQGQGVAITASTGGATPTFTVATLTDAPVSGDTFSVV